MTQNKQIILALDVGERRIGIAWADSRTRFPVPYGTIAVDGQEPDRLKQIIAELNTDIIVVGLPRNQSGEETAQSHFVREFAAKLNAFKLPVVFQDESLTSVMAEDFLKSSKDGYTKEDIDSHAAAIILTDYIETLSRAE